VAGCGSQPSASIAQASTGMCTIDSVEPNSAGGSAAGCDSEAAAR
jgi:hypothetical protein